MIADAGRGGCRIAGRAPPLAPGTIIGLAAALLALAQRPGRRRH